MLLSCAIGSVAPLSLAAGPAVGALPRTYQVQTVDSPQPALNGNFGLAFVSAGDVNGDGKDDLLVGTDEHGGSIGPVFVLSGANGSLIRAIQAPDPGGAGNPAGFGSYVGTIADIASCPGGTPGVTCPNNPSGGPDGVPDMLVTAIGVDVGGLVDAGRAYVIDGATGAVLKRLDLPAADIAEQSTAPGGAKKPAFGRTIISPSSRFGPTVVDPATGTSGPGTPPAAVRIGDLNAGGKPDIAVGASDYFETGATANPASPCAAAGGAAQCLQAGREYVYLGESIAGPSGTDPTTIDNAPDLTIKNPTAQPDDLETTVNTNRESMGYSVAPVGDLGSCTANPGPGVACPKANAVTTPDGKPDIVVSSHRTDEFGMFDVGVAYLIDGPTGSVLFTYHHPEPQPASIFAFTNYNQPAVGDLGSSSAPDVYEPAMRQNNPFTGGGRGYALNGAFVQGGSPNSISFATFNDPTPEPSEDFGTSSAGIGDVAGSEVGLDGRTEILIGDYGPHNPGTNDKPDNDVFIMSAVNEQALQAFRDPDGQPGSGFGTALAPLGDVTGDGFQDYAIGSGLWDGPAGADQGRIYLFRSDNSPAPPTPPAPAPPAGPQGPSGPAGATVVSAGRTLTLAASRNPVRRGARVGLRGALEAFANPQACERGQQVAIQRRSPTSPRYRTFRRVRTNARGSFALSAGATRTTVYRARVEQTAACLGAVSPPERVAVRRR